MINVTILTGRLTSNPELKTTQSGISVCSFSIAVERKYKQGEEKQADFINIVAWRSAAEFVSNYFKKGQMIAIEGSIQTRKYQDKDGNNRTAFEVIANNVQFAEYGKKEETDTLKEFANNLNEFQEITDNDDLPFGD